MERSRFVRFTLAVLALLAVVIPNLLTAGSTTYEGCFICEMNPAGTWPNMLCEQVGHAETGDGIRCTETEVVLITCQTSGGACFHVETGGGGDGSGSGDDGSACTIRPGSLCPAQCASCEQASF